MQGYFLKDIRVRTSRLSRKLIGKTLQHFEIIHVCCAQSISDIIKVFNKVFFFLTVS